MRFLGIFSNNLDEFFCIVDTENGDNSGPVTATWVFDITGGTDLVLSVDMGAMGDFESDDFFEWTYSIDGGPTMVAFASSVDEAGSQTYTLEGGAAFAGRQRGAGAVKAIIVGVALAPG